MSILITGGAGFIGSNLIDRLLTRSSEAVVCLDDFNDYYDPRLKRINVASFADNPRVTLVEGSFCDANAMRRLFDQHDVCRVVHLGAYPGVRASVDSPMIYQQTNAGGTLALLEAARYHTVDRFVLASSSTVYGRGAKAPYVEDAPLGVPTSPYDVSKRAAELMAATYYDLHRVPTVILRPFGVYGPRLRPDLVFAIFARAIEQGEPLPLFGDGTAQREFTHVSDVCDGFLAALDAENVIGESFNLGHTEPIEIRRLIELFEEAVGRRAKIRHLPEKPGEIPVICSDSTKTQARLGYRPTVSLSDGIADFVNWFRANADRYH